VTGAGVQVALRLARWKITPVCLTMLAEWAEKRGVEWTVAQVEADPGLTFVPTEVEPRFMREFAFRELYSGLLVVSR
jgi:hypothetical protein